MAKTEIEWCTHTWNPAKGCSKISAGCRFCYAETTAEMKQLNPRSIKYSDGFDLKESEEALVEPSKIKSPALIFTSSMTDIFHTEVQAVTRLPGISIEFLNKILAVMHNNNQHIFQVLTKRPHQIPDHFEFKKNMWFGVTVENPDAYWRIEAISRIPAPVKFLSCEPNIQKLDGIEKYLDYIDWVILGGESYSCNPVNEKEAEIRATREMHIENALYLRDLCREKGIPFFFKQWGHVGSRKPDSILSDMTIEEFRELLIHDGMSNASVKEQVKL